MSQIYIGTSGYSYWHWKGLFYPKDLPSYKWLEYYAKHFNTVELNVTFYRLPNAAAFKSWYRRTPKLFLYVCKGSRFITHVKKFKGIKRATQLFFERVGLLHEKLGIILWQLPPTWKVNIKRFLEFLKILEEQTQRFKEKKITVKHVFEFRHQSWFCKEVYNLLCKYKFGLVIADSPRFPCVEKVTADFVYLRFHGGKILYGSRYSKKELTDWAKKIKKWQKENFDIYIYFNNDAHAFAVKNAKELKKILNI